MIIPSPSRRSAEDPLLFRGTEHRAAKRFWRGTQRTISPEETLERIRPHFKRYDISRLPNITGLDRIGIHTTLAIRPNSPTLTVCSGKGFTLPAALASGAMEAIELFHAESPDLTTFSSSYDGLRGSCATIPLENLPLTRNSLFNTRWPYEWTLGWNIVDQTEVAVPSTVIEMNRNRRAGQLSAFQVTSNGLASGNDFCEAIAAALYEVIERDAVACHKLAWQRSGKPPPRVNLETVTYPLVLDLLERLRVADVRPVLYDCTVDTEVPVFMAFLYDNVTRNFGIFSGYGAHLDPEIALVRAITEAVQSRVVYIAGSRDDFFLHNFHRLKQGDHEGVRQMIDGVATVDASIRPSEATATFHGDIQVALAKLVAVGLDQVVVFDLRKEDSPVHVVKVVVPGLEGYMFDFYAPGRRALQFCKDTDACG